MKLNEGDDPADMSPSSGGHVKVVPNKWPGAMLHVGRYLQVDVDGLRRHYVSELYSSSCDRLAEEVRVHCCSVHCRGWYNMTAKLESISGTSY